MTAKKLEKMVHTISIIKNPSHFFNEESNWYPTQYYNWTNS